MNDYLPPVNFNLKIFIHTRKGHFKANIRRKNIYGIWEILIDDGVIDDVRCEAAPNSRAVFIGGRYRYGIYGRYRYRRYLFIFDFCLYQVVLAM